MNALRIVWKTRVCASVRARVRSRNSHITRIDKLNVNWSSSRDYLSTFRLSANGFSTYVLFLNVRCHLLHCYPFLAHLLIFHESMLFLRFAVPWFFFSLHLIDRSGKWAHVLLCVFVCASVLYATYSSVTATNCTYVIINRINEQLSIKE